MIQRQTFEATEKAVYSSGQRVTVDLPKSGYITHLDCLFRFNIESLGAGVARAFAQDGAAKLFQSLRIRAAGSRNYYDITDGRQWLFRNVYNYRNQMGMGMPSTVGNNVVAAADYFYLLRIHWGYDFFNMYDTTGAIPAAELQDLVLEVVWNPITSAYPGLAAIEHNLAASDMAMTVYELAFSGADKPSSIWPKGIPLPRVQAQMETIRAGYSNLGFEVDLPVGDTISQTIVINEDLATLARQDGIGTTTQTGPTELGVKFPRERATKWQMSWEQFKQLSKVQGDISEYSHATANLGANTNVPHAGVGILRWADVTGRSTGLDLTAAQQGDAKLGFTYAHDGANNGRIHLLHFMMGPGVAA